MPLYARCSRCRKRIVSGTRCECTTGIEQAPSRRAKRVEPFYSSAEWKRKRKVITDRYNNVDVWLWFTEQILVPSDLIHHIIPMKESSADALSDNNLIPLSYQSHSFVEKEYEKGIAEKTEMQRRLREAVQAWQGGIEKTL